MLSSTLHRYRRFCRASTSSKLAKFCNVRGNVNFNLSNLSSPCRSFNFHNSARPSIVTRIYPNKFVSKIGTRKKRSIFLLFFFRLEAGSFLSGKSFERNRIKCLRVAVGAPGWVKRLGYPRVTRRVIAFYGK